MYPRSTLLVGVADWPKSDTKTCRCYSSACSTLTQKDSHQLARRNDGCPCFILNLLDAGFLLRGILWHQNINHLRHMKSLHIVSCHLCDRGRPGQVCAAARSSTISTTPAVPTATTTTLKSGTTTGVFVRPAHPGARAVWRRCAMSECRGEFRVCPGQQPYRGPKIKSRAPLW